MVFRSADYSRSVSLVHATPRARTERSLSLHDILTAIAWPVVALLLGITAIVRLRPELAALITRIRKIPGGVEFADATQQIAPAPEERVQLTAEPAANGVLAAYEQAIWIDLGQFKPGPTREATLVRALAEWQLRSKFEFCVQQMWCSQLAEHHALRRELGGSIRRATAQSRNTDRRCDAWRVGGLPRAWSQEGTDWVDAESPSVSGAELPALGGGGMWSDGAALSGA
jgi:hypothetical protein